MTVKEWLTKYWWVIVLVVLVLSGSYLALSRFLSQKTEEEAPPEK